ncbi:hypothetical protein [Brevibacillus laterosporus]|uniref:hypothetical protein n=1 Tax=Brevibacillus laterosporus TaxID=1465 RepID=UPI003D1EC8D4
MKKIFALFFTVAMLFGAVLPTLTPNTAQATGLTLYMYLVERYENAKEEGEETGNHEVVDDKRVLPTEGDSFSSKDLVKKGELVQRRYYDHSGKADMDIDYTNHGNPKEHPKVPHRHDWNWKNTPPRGDGY